MTRSLTLALVVAVASVLVAVPAAWLTTRAALPGRRGWAVLMAAPLAIPSYIMAMTVVDFLGPRGTLQGWLEPLGVERLPEIYGFWGSAFTLTAASFPYVYLVLRAAFATADVSEEEASRSLGAGPLRTFFRVVLPGMVPAIAAGVLLVVLYTLSDFGAVSTLNYDTFTRSIFVEYQTSFDRTGAAVLGAMLALVAAAILAAELTVRGRMGRRASRRQSLMRPVPLGRWKWPAAGFLALIALLSLGLPLGVLGYWLVKGLQANANFPEIGSAARHSVTMAIGGAIITVLLADWPMPCEPCQCQEPVVCAATNWPSAPRWYMCPEKLRTKRPPSAKEKTQRILLSHCTASYCSCQVRPRSRETRIWLREPLVATISRTSPPPSGAQR